MGAQANRVRVMRDRLRRLRAGGALEALWSEPVCPRRARNTRYAERDAALSEAERSARLVAARATRLVHVGEPGRARAALERDSALGQIRPADVEERGVHGEVVRASVGSVAAEMLDKHPAASPLDAELSAASADDLLRAAAAGTAGAGLRAADLTRMVEELFADLPRFTRYVQRLSRLSMPGADLIRFEHVQALVRSWHAARRRRARCCGVQEASSTSPPRRGLSLHCLRWCTACVMRDIRIAQPLALLTAAVGGQCGRVVVDADAALATRRRQRPLRWAARCASRLRCAVMEMSQPHPHLQLLWMPLAARG